MVDSSREAEIKEGSKAEIETKAAVEAEVAEVVAVAAEVVKAETAQESQRTTQVLTRTCSSTGTKLVLRISVRL